MAAPDIVLTPANPLLTIPDLNSEIKKLPPVEKPEGAAKQSSESEQNGTSEAEKAVKKDSQNSKNNRLLQHLGGPNSELSIAVDKGSKKMIIKIVNSETKEVIRQIPPDELVRLAETLSEPNGALLDQTV